MFPKEFVITAALCNEGNSKLKEVLNKAKVN